MRILTNYDDRKIFPCIRVGGAQYVHMNAIIDSRRGEGGGRHWLPSLIHEGTCGDSDLR